MARTEQDREDLFAEAVAYRQAAELHPSPLDEPLFLGYRADGRLGVYLGGDLAYQFTKEMKLRRAFYDGLIFQSTGTTLSQLKRLRTQDETILQRSDLSEQQLFQFHQKMQQFLQTVQQVLKETPSAQWRIRGHGEELLALLSESLQRIEQSPATGEWLSPALR